MEIHTRSEGYGGPVGGPGVDVGLAPVGGLARPDGLRQLNNNNKNDFEVTLYF